MRWRITDLEIAPDDLVLGTLSDGTHEVTALANVHLDGRTAVLWRMHIQGAGANTLRTAGLIGLAHALMEALDVDQLYIEGASRTSGAGPGRHPAPVVFRRPRAAVPDADRPAGSADRHRVASACGR